VRGASAASLASSAFISVPLIINKQDREYIKHNQNAKRKNNRVRVRVSLPSRSRSESGTDGSRTTHMSMWVKTCMLRLPPPSENLKQIQINDEPILKPGVLCVRPYSQAECTQGEK
jgi:hypothetical protein